MTTPSHTELAAQARDLATKSSKMGARVFAEEIIICLRACAAALESPERVLGEVTPWKDMAFAKLGFVRDKMTAEHVDAVQRFLRDEFTPPTAPAQDAQGVSAILDALRVGRVACEWAEKTAEVQQIAAAMEIAKSMLSATPSPQAEKQPLSKADEALMRQALDALQWEISGYRKDGMPDNTSAAITALRARLGGD